MFTGSSDFEPLLPVLVIYDTDSEEVHLFTINDEITLEYDDSIILNFTSNIPFSEDQGELIRDTAVVNIIDNDSRCFCECELHLYRNFCHRTGD